MSLAASSLPDDPAALKAMILQLQATLRAHDLLVQSLRMRIARLKRQAFGKGSEKIAREIEQLEFALESLQVAQAEVAPPPEPESVETTQVSAAPDEQGGGDAPEKAPRRRPRVSPDTPRERREFDPGETCPECGGALRLVGEDVSQILDMITARLKLIEVARPKKSCRCCEKMVQCPAPTRPIPGSLAGPSLLAFILVAKYDDHLPLYRLNEIFARMGADIPDTTLAGWCGGAMKTLAPLVELIRKDVLASDLLHADDTPIRVLDRSKKSEFGKGVKEGRIWAYVRDQRPWSGTAPPAVAYHFSPDRKGEHPQEHLGAGKGILQADAYAGFRDLYLAEGNGEARFCEAACWAHLRRAFFEVEKETGSDIAREALERIGALYDIEAQIRGRSADERRAVRQAHSRPKVKAFKAWAEEQLEYISGKSDLAKAFRYALNRWDAFGLFLEDGRVAIDNNPAERAMRPIGIGRKNWLFAGNDAGGETLARAMTLIESAKLSGLDPLAYLADVLARINDHINPRLYELLPWNWKPLPADDNKIAA
ncbi:IS66 family transposase [Cereibacter sphaeroides]|uniref:IS66 family transposase n=1 Tax=Cereibacter sphaeroides TaxID=1063 RepID=UPI001F3B3361|nr:IS66 family transposase [Cereibacter sphaeroides]MCE6949723.1 IS66 family transposase [Cereibacter sphaeroides]